MGLLAFMSHMMKQNLTIQSLETYYKMIENPEKLLLVFVCQIIS